MLSDEYRVFYKNGCCRCTISQRLVGDGCIICNPDQSYEMQDEYIKELEAEIDKLKGVTV